MRETCFGSLLGRRLYFHCFVVNTNHYLDDRIIILAGKKVLNVQSVH